MECEICGVPATDLAIVPIKQENGSLITIACIPCARRLGVFCDQHQRPHLGFEGGTHACVLCIEEEVESMGITEYRQAFCRVLPSDQRYYLKQWAPHTEGLPESKLLRALVTHSHCNLTPVKEIISRILTGKNIYPFIPEEVLTATLVLDA